MTDTNGKQRRCPCCSAFVFPVLFVASDLPRLDCQHHRTFWSWACDCYWHERRPVTECPLCRAKKNKGD